MKYKTFNMEGISCKVPLDTPIIFTRNNNRFGWHLATISKEEQSKNLMMEQVPKDKPYSHEGWQEEGERLARERKQDKPVCEHKLSNIETHDQDGTFHINGDTCSKCGKHILDWESPKSNPIEDTNKTRLEVPEKIIGFSKNGDVNIGSLSYAGSLIIVDKINSIIDYLTLISLDKND